MKMVASRLFAASSRRAFSTTPRRLDNYAFVGLGQMVRPFILSYDAISNHATVY